MMYSGMSVPDCCCCTDCIHSDYFVYSDSDFDSDPGNCGNGNNGGNIGNGNNGPNDGNDNNGSNGHHHGSGKSKFRDED